MNHLTAGLIIVVGILGGFYAGARYGQGHPTPSASPAAATSPGGGAGGAGGGFGGGAAAFGGPVATGTIVAVSGNQITVHDRLGNRDVKVNVGAARVTKTTQGSAADLMENETVTVTGQAGTDGVVTAQTIAVGGGGGGRGGGGGFAQPSPGG